MSKKKPSGGNAYDDYLDYLDYDEAYEDAVFEQSERIRRANRKSKAKPQSTNLIAGVVVRALGHHYEVLTDPQLDPLAAGRPRLCEVRGRLLQERTIDTLVAVGDRVQIVPEEPQRGKIEIVEERESVISRQQPGRGVAAEDVILANPDQVLVVFAAANPEPHLRMVDRFLVIAEYNELPALICVNKIDLPEGEAARALFSIYEPIGYRVLFTSAETGEGIDELRALLGGKLTVLTGPSGVGKSSLINALYPDFDLATGDLRTFLGKGKHTTRSARLLRLPDGDHTGNHMHGEPTFVADTPGIRELGLYEIDPADLGFYFIDIKPYVNDCRFPNCTHDHEPGCAVRAAVDAGAIEQARYESYLRLLHGEE